jgi:hypothetical protein
VSVLYYRKIVTIALVLGLNAGCHAANPDYGLWDSHFGTGGSGLSGGGGTSGGFGGSAGALGPGASGGSAGATTPGTGPRTDGATPDLTDGAAPTRDATAPDDGAAPVDFTGDLKKGLTLYLPLDDNGGAVAADASGKQCSASLKSVDATAAWIEGRIGKAVALAGAVSSGAAWSGWIDVSGAALTSAVSQSFTVGMWIWRKDLGGTLFSRGLKGALVSFALDGDTLLAQLNGAAAYKLSLRAGAPVPADKWVHVALTFDLKQVRLYVGGVGVGAAAYQQAVSLDTSSFIVGGLAQSGGTVSGRFSGKIDEVVLYTRALSASEIGGLAGGARPPTP